MDARKAEVSRKTKETDVSITLDLDGRGRYDVSTSIGMLDHMLESLAKHALFDLHVRASGDTDRDTHHLLEDVGLVLGQALDRALGERRGITRFGHAVVPLDECLALVAVDLSGRPFAAVELPFARDRVGEMPTENVAHLMESFATEGRLNLHVRMLAHGQNDHHTVEAAFKGLARALRMAVAIDARQAGEIPSTKDRL